MSENESEPVRRPWRDVRDGIPPPAFFEVGRRALADAHKNLIPPLHPVDVLMLVGEAIAAKFFYPAVKRDGPPKMFAYLWHDISAIHALLVADPSYADKAGIIWAPREDDQRYAVECALHSWKTYVFARAHIGPWCTDPDLSLRGRMIHYQAQQIFRGFFRPNYHLLVPRLTRAVVNNVGGSEWDAEQREDLSPEVAQNWFKAIGDFGPRPMEAFEFGEDQHLTLSVEGTGAVLEEHVGRGKDLDKRPLSLDQDDAGASALLRTSRDPKANEPREVVSISDLRDLRELHELQRRHPLLDRFAERAMNDAERAGDVADLLSRLVPILDKIEDAATQAAVVYAFGAQGGGHGAWSREEVASTYGVSVRQLEGRAEQAVVTVRRLLAG